MIDPIVFLILFAILALCLLTLVALLRLPTSPNDPGGRMWSQPPLHPSHSQSFPRFHATLTLPKKPSETERAEESESPTKPSKTILEWLTIECANPDDLEQVLDEQSSNGWELFEIYPIMNPLASVEPLRAAIDRAGAPEVLDLDSVAEANTTAPANSSGCTGCTDVSQEPPHPVTYTVVFCRELAD